jgi:GT2 family glycosyltransferase
VTPVPDLTTPTSVVIATTGAGGAVWDEDRSFVLEAVRSLRATSRHEALEFVVVHTSSTPAMTLTALVEVPDVDLVLVSYDGPATSSAPLNVGALHASGRALVFVDERSQAMSDETVGHLVGPLSTPEVGMVGPKLLSPDGSVRSAGLRVSDGQVASPWRGLPDSPDTTPDLFRDRVVDALDACCVAIDADVFHAVGGWSQEVPARYRHLDLGFKIRREGRALHWSAAAALWCFAPDPDLHQARPWETEFVTRRWGKDLSPAT